jgi:hypothetical protein
MYGITMLQSRQLQLTNELMCSIPRQLSQLAEIVIRKTASRSNSIISQLGSVAFHPI